MSVVAIKNVGSTTYIWYVLVVTLYTAFIHYRSRNCAPAARKTAANILKDTLSILPSQTVIHTNKNVSNLEPTTNNYI